MDFAQCQELLTNAIPTAGDVVLARVEEIGQHKKIELANSRRASLYVGDEIIVTYGNRYAPDQFEATVPKIQAPCHLVAAGGIAAQFISKHASIKAPTLISPIAILGDGNGQPVNLSQFSLSKKSIKGQRPITLAVVGSSMNSGKTTTAASLIKGLINSGLKVGAAKITGTGAGGDTWLMKDSGAHPVLDFVDAGAPSTYLLSPDKIETILETLTAELSSSGVEVIILEIADGLYQEETATLVTSKIFKEKVDGLIFAAGDAMGSWAGVQWLQQSTHIPIMAVAGKLTSSPLATREAKRVLDMTVLTIKDLISPSIYGFLQNCLSPQEMLLCSNS
ncbi:MAG: DUF1611 domain-containing protein [Pseudomonadota bacterium]|nr:DUF1611 domain-containing protein [Pseudomonadota bacterium]